MEISSPQVLQVPLKVPKKLLMGPGPSNCHPRVLQALSQQVIGHMHPETFKIMDDIKEGLRYVFQTRNELTLAVSASGHGGMEAVLCNLIEPGDKVLVAINGIWGVRAADMAERYGAIVTKINTRQLNQPFTDDELENELRRVRPKVLFIVQGDSCTGLLQPLQNLGHMCHRYNCLLAVDTVASLGGTPMFVDRWGVDAIYSGSQKVLGAPPGLAPLSFSPLAQKAIFSRRTPVKVFYFDMRILGEQWDCFGTPRPYHHTLSSNLLAGFREGLALIAEEGLENVLERHRRCAQRLYGGLKRIGLKLFVDEETKRLPTVTTISLPEHIDGKDITSYMMQNYSVEISGGLGPTTGKVLRVGLMGYNATFYNVDLVLKLLEEALNHVRQYSTSKL